VLGHYVVAKLGFTALLIAASVLEGRAIRLVVKYGLVKGLVLIFAIALTLCVLCGTVGFFLTPVVFGPDFAASGQAFPLLALAGGLAFVFVCVSAANAQKRRASFLPGLAILISLVLACVFLAHQFGSNVVAISLALVLAQGIGVVVVVGQYFSRKGRHR